LRPHRPERYARSGSLHQKAADISGQRLKAVAARSSILRLCVDPSATPTIPDPALMMELGRRVTNIQGYREPATKKYFVPEGEMQPQRTDLERDGKERVTWIDVKLSPMAD
jgi:hypothetical protein